MDKLLVCLILGYIPGSLLVCTIDLSRELENVALNKSAIQISTWYAGNPGKAVDGNGSPVFGDDSCTHTSQDLPTEPYKWWMVDLQVEYSVTSVMITNRLLYAGRLRDFDIYVTNNSTRDSNGVLTEASLCSHVDGPMGSGEISVLNCTTPIVGQFVEISMNTSDDLRPLTLCEVSIQAYEVMCSNDSTEEELHYTNCPPNTCTPYNTTRTVNSSSQDLCTCKCLQPSVNTTYITQDVLQELVHQLRQELTVERKETSISKRKFVSVADSRRSSTVIGIVGGLALCIPLCCIISCDLINVWKFISKR